jgi:hypothetical protein
LSCCEERTYLYARRRGLRQEAGALAWFLAFTWMRLEHEKQLAVKRLRLTRNLSKLLTPRLKKGSRHSNEVRASWLRV